MPWMPRTPKASFTRHQAGQHLCHSRGQAKLLDFGLAKLTSAPEGGLSSAPTACPSKISPVPLHHRHRRVHESGTSPGKELDSRTDLFSFGAVLYEMCTGVLPFRRQHSGMIFDAILNRASTPASRLNSAIPSRLEELSTRLWKRIARSLPVRRRIARRSQASAARQFLRHSRRVFFTRRRRASFPQLADAAALWLSWLSPHPQWHGWPCITRRPQNHQALAAPNA